MFPRVRPGLHCSERMSECIRAGWAVLGNPLLRDAAVITGNYIQTVSAADACEVELCMQELRLVTLQKQKNNYRTEDKL